MSTEGSKIYSVIGAKDGAGASTFALNFAFLMAKSLKESVLVIDFDFNCQGDISYLLNNKWKDLNDIFLKIDKGVPSSFLHGYLSNNEDGVSFLKAFDPERELDSNLLVPGRIAQVLDYLSGAFDNIIIDCGSVITHSHVPVLACAGKIFVVTLPALNCLGMARKKYERMMKGFIPSEKINFVVNRWVDDGRITRNLISEKLPKQARYFLNNDPTGMEKSYEKYAPLVLSFPALPYSKSFEECRDDGLFDVDKRGFVVSDVLSGDGSAMVERWLTAHQPSQNIPRAEEISKPKPKEIVEIQEFDDGLNEIKQKILDELLKTIDLKQVDVCTKKDQKERLTKQTTEAIFKIINEIGEDKIPQGKRKQVVEEVINEALGLGPLEVLMADKNISEVMINGKNQIYVERKGKLTLSDMRFSSEKQLRRIIERIVSPIGRRVDESTPLVDARLADGSRVNIIIPPLALKGPTVTIRRFSENPLKVEDLIKFGALTKEMAEFLKACIEARLNIIVSGGTGTGKTTLLNVLSSFIPHDDRIVTIEDAAELKLNQPHVVTLEARPPNIEGKGAITIRDLVKNSLRMRPDRIVVGECRGGEALDMLQAMNTGHDGSMTTVHANSAKDAVSRLETLVLFSGLELPSKAIREQVVSGIHLIVQLSRFSDGTRKITDISELTGMEGSVVTLQSIFAYRQKGVDQDRKVIGSFMPTGVVPKFFDELQQKGINFPRSIFVEGGM